MRREEEIRRQLAKRPRGQLSNRQRYRQEKPIYAPSQYTGLPLKFSGRLEQQGWRFKPSRNLGDKAGHWVPPGYKVIPGAAKSISGHGKYSV